MKFSKRQLIVVGLVVVAFVALLAASPFLTVNLPTTNSTSTSTQSNTTTSVSPPPATEACAASDAYKNAVKQNWSGGYSWHSQKVVTITELMQIARNHNVAIYYGQFAIGGTTSPVSLYVPIPNYVYYYDCSA